MDWFRWHTGSTTDPKFRVVARKAAQAVPGVRLSDVLAVWAMILERASEADERGVIEGYDCEGADAHLDLPDGAACAIVQAMQDKGLLADERVAKWDQRQPKREDSTATERKRAQRERDREAKANVTHGHALSRTVTHGHDRGEEIRREENKDIPTNTQDDITARVRASGHPPGEQPGGFGEVGSDPVPELEGMPIEFQDLVAGYPQGRADIVPAFKAYMAVRKVPGFSIQRVLSDVAQRCASQKWQRGYSPNLSRYLREQIWKNPPEDDRAPPGPMASPESQAFDQIAEKLRRSRGKNHEHHELPESHAKQRSAGS